LVTRTGHLIGVRDIGKGHGRLTIAARYGVRPALDAM
jgi:hypothetical protein